MGRWYRVVKTREEGMKKESGEMEFVWYDSKDFASPLSIKYTGHKNSMILLSKKEAIELMKFIEKRLKEEKK